MKAIVHNDRSRIRVQIPGEGSLMSDKNILKTPARKRMEWNTSPARCLIYRRINRRLPLPGTLIKWRLSLQ